MLHEYELVLIARPDTDEPTTYAAIERVETSIADDGGHVLLRDDWGKRKLAYGIKKHVKGHYVVLHCLMKASQVTEVERRIRLDETLLRFLTVRVAEAVDVEARVAAAAEVRRVRDEETRRRAEAAAAAQAAAEAEAARHAAAKAAAAAAQPAVVEEPAAAEEPVTPTSTPSA